MESPPRKKPMASVIVSIAQLHNRLTPVSWISIANERLLHKHADDVLEQPWFKSMSLPQQSQKNVCLEVSDQWLGHESRVAYTEVDPILRCVWGSPQPTSCLFPAADPSQFFSGNLVQPLGQAQSSSSRGPPIFPASELDNPPRGGSLSIALQAKLVIKMRQVQIIDKCKR